MTLRLQTCCCFAREDKGAAVVVAAQPAGQGGGGLLIQVPAAEQKLERCLFPGEVPGHVESAAKVPLSKVPAARASFLTPTP